VEGIKILYTMTLHIVNSFFRTFVHGTLVEILSVRAKRSHPVLSQILDRDEKVLMYRLY